jgi:hypothetical protein
MGNDPIGMRMLGEIKGRVGVTAADIGIEYLHGNTKPHYPMPAIPLKVKWWRSASGKWIISVHEVRS